MLSVPQEVCFLWSSNCCTGGIRRLRWGLRARVSHSAAWKVQLCREDTDTSSDFYYSNFHTCIAVLLHSTVIAYFFYFVLVDELLVVALLPLMWQGFVPLKINVCSY